MKWLLKSNTNSQKAISPIFFGNALKITKQLNILERSKRFVRTLKLVLLRLENGTEKKETEMRNLS